MSYLWYEQMFTLYSLNNLRDQEFKVTKSISFKTKNSSEAFWTGFAKQTIDFQHAIGELVDNALSNPIQKTVGRGHQTTTVEIVLTESQDDKIEVIVADAGTGVKLDALTGEDNIFNLGYRPSEPGTMNEHGFGLKNALALMTSGFQENFVFFTKALNENEALYKVSGPISEEMTAEPVNLSEWGEKLELVKDAGSGVKVEARVKREYFNTIYTRGKRFETLVERLGEHFGVMYCHYLREGHEIYIRYKSKEAQGYNEQKIQAIDPPFLITPEIKTEKERIEVEYAGEKYTAMYTQGRLDTSIKDSESKEEKGWPYPLKIHYQGSNARCGVTLVVRNRVLKTGVFREIWPERSGDVSFNNFLGELILEQPISTTNNKTDLDPHDEIWSRFRDKLKERSPEKITKKQSEENLRQLIIQQIANVNNLSGQHKPKHKKVWDGGAEIDIYYKKDDKIFIVETKVTKAKIQDAYQLLMYWDGLVDAGSKPHEGILIASTISPNVHKAIESINNRCDANNNNYNLRTQLRDEWDGGNWDN